MSQWNIQDLIETRRNKDEKVEMDDGGLMGIKRTFEKIGTEEVKERACAAKISTNIREARLRLLGHVERKTDEDVVMRRWKMEDGRESTPKEDRN